MKPARQITHVMLILTLWFRPCSQWFFIFSRSNPLMSYRSILNVKNGGPSNPKVTLKINSLRIKRKAQNFASRMLREYACKIGRKKGNYFLIIVRLQLPTRTPVIQFISNHACFQYFLQAHANTHFHIETPSLCIRFDTWKVQHLNQSLPKAKFQAEPGRKNGWAVLNSNSRS